MSLNTIQSKIVSNNLHRKQIFDFCEQEKSLEEIQLELNIDMNIIIQEIKVLTVCEYLFTKNNKLKSIIYENHLST